MTRCILFAVPVLVGLSATAHADPAELEQIRQQIAAKGLQWEAGETRLSQLPKAQRARLRLPYGSVPPWWNAQGESRPRPPGLARPHAPNPPSLDWRSYKGFNFLTAPRDQGSCGSCWAFSIIGTLEGTVSYRRSQANPTLDLSEQNLADCATSSIGCDSGGITWDIGIGVGGEGYIKSTGVTTETCYPYTSGQSGTLGSCQTMSGACAAATKAEDYDNVTASAPSIFPWEWADPDPYVPSQDVVDEIKTRLQERPVGVSMRAYDDLSYYQKGIYEPANLTQGSGMHAVVIVGYDDAGGYWIVRNSWGEDFGEGGYFRAKYGTSSIGMFAYTLQYDEANQDPEFCPDLPKTLTLVGTLPKDLKIANCGANILDWSAQVSPAVLQIKDASGKAVTAGSVVAAGTTYKVSASQAQPSGGSGTITLSGAPNGPVSIAVTLAPDPPDAAAPGPDAAPPGPDAAPPGPDAAPPGLDANAVSAADGGTVVGGDDSSLPHGGKDGGTEPSAVDAGDPDVGQPGGCGCSATASGASLFLMGAVCLGALARRRRG